MLSRTWRWAKWLVLMYLVLGAILFFTQQLFIFRPRKLPADHQFSFNEPFREINVPVHGEKNVNIIQFTVPDTARRGVVLYFHGNRENIYRYAGQAPFFTGNGYEVWMIDYPGFGKSTGSRTEKILNEDALLLYRMANARFPAEQIVIYGRSLGSGIAARLAMVRECRRLILETPYYSITALAGRYFPIYPVRQLLKFRFPTFEYFEFIEEPITLLHGTRDRVIPYRHSKWLLAKNKNATLVTIPDGKHNNLSVFPGFRQALDSLLRR